MTKLAWAVTDVDQGGHKAGKQTGGVWLMRRDSAGCGWVRFKAHSTTQAEQFVKHVRTNFPNYDAAYSYLSAALGEPL
jgi:hypothetical protein